MNTLDHLMLCRIYANYARMVLDTAQTDLDRVEADEYALMAEEHFKLWRLERELEADER